MSIGNLKDTGNQGNNLPFQWKVLQGLQSIITNGLFVFIKGPLGQLPMGNSVSTVLAYDQANVMVSPAFQKVTNAVGDTSGITILSISFASVGTANALVSVDGGMIYENLAPGETLNLDASGIMNYYNGNNFHWDTITNAGSSLLIAYNYI